MKHIHIVDPYESAAMNPAILDVKMVFMEGPHSLAAITEALKGLEIRLRKKINPVQSSGSTRCFYCGVKQDEDAKTCSQCGAPL